MQPWGNAHGSGKQRIAVVGMFLNSMQIGQLGQTVPL